MGINIDSHLQELDKLVGGTITQLILTEYDDERYYGVVVTKSDGQKLSLVFLRDDEGNGPGSFEVGSL